MAGKAQHDGLPPRIRGLAAQQQAQGHALAGDHAACMRSLEKARRLLERDEPGDGPVIGSSNLPDQVSMIHGWCLHDLGRPQEAAAVLDVQTGQVPVHARRARGLRHFFVDAATTIGRAEAVDDLRGRFAPPAGDLSDDQEDGKGDGTVD